MSPKALIHYISVPKNLFAFTAKYFVFFDYLYAVNFTYSKKQRK